jgi:hypothetical protein
MLQAIFATLQPLLGFVCMSHLCRLLQKVASVASGGVWLRGAGARWTSECAPSLVFLVFLPCRTCTPWFQHACLTTSPTPASCCTLYGWLLTLQVCQGQHRPVSVLAEPCCCCREGVSWHL